MLLVKVSFLTTCEFVIHILDSNAGVQKFNIAP